MSDILHHEHEPISRLKAEHLMKAYNGRVVVKDVSMEVSSGQVVGLLGRNGAGKTTCFYMIAGLVATDGGNIVLDEHSISHLPIHRRARLGLSYLPQEASVFRKLSVEENILAVLELQVDKRGRGISRAEQKARLESLLKELQIEHIRSNTSISLSGGERRRVEIARALASSPRFILLDEPFAGVDPIAVIEIQRIVNLLKNRRIGVLITDHNVRETLGICDRAYIINEGVVLASAAHHDRRVQTRLGQHRSHHGRGAGLAVTAGHRDAVALEPHQFGQHLGPLHDRDLLRHRGRHFRVVEPDGAVDRKSVVRERV